MQERVRGILIDNGIITLIKRVTKNGAYYVFPGGGIEIGEVPEQALKREIKEELGLDVEVGDLLISGYFDESVTKKKEYFYICKTVSGKLGTGTGPEYTPGNDYDGTHEPVRVSIKETKTLKLLPQNIKNLLIKKYG